MNYQRVGVEWLEGREAAILADDMGLGKTVQAIIALARLVRATKLAQAVVIAPRTVLGTWEAELTKWAPDLTRLRVTPTAEAREEAWRAVSGRVHVVITNYEQLRDPPEALLGRTTELIVADEAHRLRNLQSRVTSGIASLPRERIWALTGTPLERDPLDTATILSLLDPHRFARQDARLPIAALRARAKPYTLRRHKADVLDELPELIESVERLDLLPHQRARYDEVMVERLDNSPGAVLKRITELRQLCDMDPLSGESAKADRIIEHLEMIETQHEKAVVFSHMLAPLDLLRTRLAASGGPEALHLTGDTSAREREGIISRFGTDSSVTALLASTRVAGEGLTLTAANHVIFFNEWWNPSADMQARDRVVRLGQQRGVRVYRFRCRKTIEESLQRILETKKDLFEQLINGMSAGADVPATQLSLLLSGESE